MMNPLNRIWTVADAKARLSEFLRLASTEGRHRIGARTPSRHTQRGRFRWPRPQHRQSMADAEALSVIWLR
jgi:hypothetical protein